MVNLLGLAIARSWYHNAWKGKGVNSCGPLGKGVAVIERTSLQKEVAKLQYTNTYLWNLEKWYRWTYLQGRNRDTENRCAHRGKGESGANWDRGTDINILCCCLVAKSCLILCHPIDCTHQAPLSMGFPRQEHWSGLPFPSPGGLLDPGIESRLLHCKGILYRRATREVLMLPWVK